MEPVTDEGFQDFSAAGEHFVSKGIQLCGVGIFADKGSSGVGNALGNADDHIGCFFKGTLQILVKGLQLKGSLGEVDEDRVVSVSYTHLDVYKRQLLNVIWLLVSGLPLALEHVAMGLLLCVTILGIPFGLQQFKLAKLALLPFGAEVVIL